MNQNKQIEIMEAQLSRFESLFEKMTYMSMFFDPDPMFTQRARDIVRSNISKELSCH